MQINNISPDLILKPQNQNFDAQLLELKDLIRAEVISVSGKNVLLKTDANVLLRTFNNSTPDFIVGDTLDFVVTSNEGSNISLQIKAVNSQNIIPTANGKQELLMKMNVDPSLKNLEIAELLVGNDIKPTPAAIKNFTRITTKFPDIPKDVAVIFAKYPAIINSPGIFNFVSEKYIPGFMQFNKIISEIETAAANIAQYTQTPEQSENSQPSGNVLADSGNIKENDTANIKENPKGPEINIKNDLSENIKTGTDSVYEKKQPSFSDNTKTPDYDIMKNDSVFFQKNIQQTSNIIKSLKNIFAPLATFEEASGKELKQATSLAHIKLQNIVRQLPDSLSDIKSSVQTLKEQNQLIHEMNNFYFAQIPFMFNDHRNTADLYVMKRNARTKTVDPNNAKIALCLQTENIGMVESVITIESKNVNLQIRVESDETAWQIKSFASDLAELLHNIGYHLNSLSVKKFLEPISPLNIEQCFNTKKPQKIGMLDLEL